MQGISHTKILSTSGKANSDAVSARHTAVEVCEVRSTPFAWTSLVCVDTTISGDPSDTVAIYADRLEYELMTAVTSVADQRSIARSRNRGPRPWFCESFA